MVLAAGIGVELGSPRLVFCSLKADLDQLTVLIAT